MVNVAAGHLCLPASDQKTRAIACPLLELATACRVSTCRQSVLHQLHCRKAVAVQRPLASTSDNPYCGLTCVAGGSGGIRCGCSGGHSAGAIHAGRGGVGARVAAAAAVGEGVQRCFAAVGIIAITVAKSWQEGGVGRRLVQMGCVGGKDMCLTVYLLGLQQPRRQDAG